MLLRSIDGRRSLPGRLAVCFAAGPGSLDLFWGALGALGELSRRGNASAALSLALVLLVAPPPASAHLMVAQHGTLNFQGDGGYLVLSLPVSAFAGVDDNSDGRLSMAELRAHQATISTAVQQQVQLRDAKGPRPLDGLMLTLSPPHEGPTMPADQLVVMGRYALASPDQSLSFKLNLFGTQAAEKTLQFTVTKNGAKQEMTLHPTSDWQTLHLAEPRGALAYLKTAARQLGATLDRLWHSLPGVGH